MKLDIVLDYGEAIDDWSSLHHSLDEVAKLHGCTLSGVYHLNSLQGGSQDAAVAALEQTTQELKEREEASAVLVKTLGKQTEMIHHLTKERDGYLDFLGITEPDPKIRLLALWLCTWGTSELDIDEGLKMARGLVDSEWMKDFSQHLLTSYTEDLLQDLREREGEIEAEERSEAVVPA